MSYASAGVDSEEVEAGLQRLARRVKATWLPHRGLIGSVTLDIGYFANVIDLGMVGLAMCTDGIGSKAIIAQMMDKYDTVGIDCVAMNVNDLICVGARPLSMVDYIALQQANPNLIDALSIGLTEGARCANVSISGGEISQLKDIIQSHRDGFGFDLVGMAVGDVPLEKVNTGRDVQPDDVVIGVESNGIHSNGLSLARQALFEMGKIGISHQFDDLELTLGEELLRPTHIYVREVLEILRSVKGIKAMVHITGDGLLNLARVTAPVGFVIDAMPAVPPIFSVIQHYGGIDKAEMYQVFNMGIGFCLVVAPDSVGKTMNILASYGRQAHQIGHAVVDQEKRIWVDNLVGRGKRFNQIPN